MNSLDDDGSLLPTTVSTLSRVLVNLPMFVRVRRLLVARIPKLTIHEQKDFENDFIANKQTHYEYIRKLQQWRQKFETFLDARPRLQPLAHLSHYLTEFQYSKIDEIEVPGQYTEVSYYIEWSRWSLMFVQDKDSHQYFIRIQKFAPKFEMCRSNGSYWKRVTLHGNDNSRTSFVVQLPCQRHFRREDRVAQIFRTFNGFVNSIS